MHEYPPIADYAILSDCNTAALVSMAGAVEWLCLPAFDSPSVFAAILDRERGGRFTITPAGVRRITRRYLPGTNVLETRFETGSGVVLLTDFLALSPDRNPEDPEDVISNHCLVRRIHVEEGTAEVMAACAPRPDYGRNVPSVEAREGGRRVLFHSETRDLTLLASRPMEAAEGAARGEWELRRGERVDLLLGETPGDGWERRIGEGDVQRLFDATTGYWRDWISGLQHEGPYKAAVERSALTLKALIYEPTGAIIAAPSTSLPEEIGGRRNWDYRYCWIRDASFTLSALSHLGYTREAVRYFDWLQNVTREDPENMRVLYGIHEASLPKEIELGHLEGYRRSSPVRVGNAAVEQFQMDAMGEVVDSYYLFRDVLGHGRKADLDWLFRIVESAGRRWMEPDAGIWEIRAPSRHFVHSKALAWAALERGARLADAFGGGRPREWRDLAGRIAREILEKGFDERRNTFVQAYGRDALDASVLRLPLIGFIDGRDPRMLGTIDAIQRELTRDGLVYRYTHRDDGLPGGEGVFSICTFWLVQCLALAGRQREAEDIFERMLEHGNDLGLFSEEIDPASGDMLGNFPQGFTHIGLINAAERLQGTNVAGESVTHLRA